jgi:hypothetical protein
MNFGTVGKMKELSTQTEDDHLFPRPSVFDIESPSALMIKTALHCHIPEPAKPISILPGPVSYA